MEGKEDQRKVEEITRIVLRPLASPLPLAFFTFGVGSVLQNALQLGLIPQDESQNLALIFGGVVFPSMFLAAVFAFLSRETLGATALGLISFSWLATSLVTYTSAPDPTSAALGVLSLALAAILLLLGSLGVLGKPVLSAVILLAFFRYGLNGIYELTASATAQTASGVVGCAIFAAALYGGLALGLEDVQHRTVLPFGRRGRRARRSRGRERADRPGREGGRRPQAALGTGKVPGDTTGALTRRGFGHYPSQ
ncbi:hypothetical protein GBA65_02745 [Rubrobacter marinus]|uniref:GPR1/FUN34/yaaH family protein n=1 Tax=Rubrobacter marinus TaxID=2653852 RepID=A0A6G8PTE8_9ACTN|nr:hypothetical protein [Rubrobacter marinus]QIN77603.1 hypothetical protein GBA65_02745 [Rubrobacter marinus]